MAYKLSTYMGNKVIDATLNGTSFTPPASLYLALFTSDPDFDGSGDEVAGGSYARQVVTFGAAASRQIVQDSGVTFTLPTAVTTHFGLYDASTAGNLLIFGELPNTIITNDEDTITVSNLTIGLSEG
jgi:hypothetical protein